MRLLYIVLIGAIMVLALGVRPIKNQSELFDSKSTYSVKGLALFLAILYLGNFEFNRLPGIVSHLNYLMSAVFLFIAGYANTSTIDKNNRKPFKWFVSKMLSIYVPFVFFYLLSLFTIRVLHDIRPAEFLRNIRNLILLDFPIQQIYMSKVIVMCFAVQFAAFFIFKNKKAQLALVTLILAAYVIGMIKIGKDSFYYTSVLCFPLGIAFSRYGDKLKTTIYKMSVIKKLAILAISGIISVVVVYLGKLNVLYRIPETLILMATMFVVLCIIKFHLAPLEFLGKNSWTFFLFIYICLMFFRIQMDVEYKLYFIQMLSVPVLFTYAYTIALKNIKKKLLRIK